MNIYFSDEYELVRRYKQNSMAQLVLRIGEHVQEMFKSSGH